MAAKSDMRLPLVGLVAGGVGLLVGFAMGAATAPATASGAASEAAESAGSGLTLDVGKGRRDGSYTMIPVVLTNGTGRDLSYAKVTCALYDKSGQLIGSDFTNWSDVPAGAKVSGEVGSRTRGIHSYECGAGL